MVDRLSVFFTVSYSVSVPSSVPPVRSGGQQWPRKWGSPFRRCRLPCRKLPAGSQRVPCCEMPHGQWRHKGKNIKPVVNVYNFDYFRTKNIGYRFNEFETYNIEWLKFVVDCRNGKDVFSDYDIVIGGVANDKVIDTVEDYEKGIITAEQALGQLRYKDVNHQICILNQEIIDYCLEFVESYTL